MPVLDANACTRDFALKVASVVSQSDKIVVPERMPGKFLHYFERIIPAVTDKSVLYRDCLNGDWIVATEKQVEELAQDGRFRQVYYDPNEEFYHGKFTAGALFHKSAPIFDKTM